MAQPTSIIRVGLAAVLARLEAAAGMGGSASSPPSGAVAGAIPIPL